MAEVWRRCSSCKKEIPCGSEYYVCSVSTCRQKKTNYAFCSVECWDKHIPIERHRSDSVSAIAKRAPAHPEGAADGEQKRRVIVTSSAAQNPSFKAAGGTSVDGEVLVVASKVKKYISERSNMNTSASTMDALTEKIRFLCDRAIENARADGRKTVMDRDVP